MESVVSDRSSRFVMGWVRLYSRGLPVEAAERRRAELESDLWEHCHDPDEPGEALVGRCLRGVPADLWWRYRTLTTTREARRRDIERSLTWNWWVALTGLIGVATIVIAVGGGLAGTGGTTSGLAIAGTIGALISGGLMLAGLYKRSTDLVAGSWMTVIGALAGGPFGLPVAAVIVISGLWSGNLQFSTATRRDPRLVVARRNQRTLTRRWYLWLVGAAGLFGFGLLFPLLVFNEDTTNTVTSEPGVLENLLGAAGWIAWWGSWLAAVVTTGIGILLGVAHLFVRRRPTYPQPGAVTST